MLRSLLIVISVFASKISIGLCSDPPEPYYFPFYKNFSDSNRIHPFIFNPESDMFWYDAENYEVNLEAWETHFKSKYSSHEIKAVLYDLDLEQCKALINGNDKNSSSNRFQKALLAKKHNDFLQYLVYAKKCEKYASYRRELYYWHREDHPIVQDSVVVDSLFQTGKQYLESENNLELKTRYGFQLVRLAHYRNNYALGAKVFNQYVKPLQSEKYIYYRALEQYAGILQATGKEDSAGYFFSRVFEKCPDRRQTCVNSFDYGKSEFEGVLAMCQNKQEQTILYAMRALNYWSNPEEEMLQIAAVDSCSPYVELFFTRLIYEWEQEIMIQDWGWRTNDINLVYPSLTYEAITQLQELYRFAENLKKNCAEDRREFWQFNQAYLKVMQRQYGEAEALLKSIQAKKYKKQIYDLSFVCELLQIDVLTPEKELELDNREKNFSSEVLAVYDNFLRIKFYESSQYAKAFLMGNNSVDFLGFKLSWEMMELIDEFKRTTPKTKLEKQLQDKISFDQLYAFMGAYKFQKGHFEDALNCYNKITTLSNYAYEANFASEEIFRSSIRHYYDTTFVSRSYPIERSSKKNALNINYDYEYGGEQAFAQLFFSLDSLATQLEKSNKQEASILYYNLGSAWNNMSPHGYFRTFEFSDYWHPYNNAFQWHFDYGYHNYSNWDNWVKGTDSAYNSKTGLWQFEFYMNSSRPDYNYKIGRGYLMKALDLSRDKELKAKILFKLSETDLYMGYDGLENNRKKWYAELAKYDKTDYYQEVIEECGYFKHFVDHQ